MALTDALTMGDSARIDAAYRAVRDRMLAMRGARGHWVGELASSALSTAAAVSALSLVARSRGEPDGPSSAAARAGLDWLMRSPNADGGFGDTDRSHSNIATTLLTIAACRIAGRDAEFASVVERAEAYVARLGMLDGLRLRYGRDRTFAVPILTNAALAGMVPWNHVAALPFELACLPQSWYRYARLPVVSYAIPALVAIGQARHWFAPSRFPPLRWLRRASVAPSLRVLERMQPASGGFLEATPLTAFVVMSLAATGRHDHPVTRRGAEFLLASMRPDGSWPIDTNLATWNTTLAVNAFAAAGEDVRDLIDWQWLLGCQHRARHPFTGAEPGGWGWTDLSGAVPDSDDTPGALLALAALHKNRRAPQPVVPFRGNALSSAEPAAAPLDPIEAARAGLDWLLRLQNADGGWPTFCRGWGRLPFDRSGPDLTAHALRALKAWTSDASHEAVDASSFPRIAGAARRGFAYLKKHQRSDGAWLPLWFGNQDEPEEANPVYGTSRVLMAYADWRIASDPAAVAARDWLVAAQHEDAAWGTTAASAATRSSSVEETAVAVDALVAIRNACPTGELDSRAAERIDRAVLHGAEWLVERVESGTILCSPIGLYFAKLWYHEALYPWSFTLSALGRLRSGTTHGRGEGDPDESSLRTGNPDPGAIKGHEGVGSD